MSDANDIYYHSDDIFDNPYAFNFLIGGRGIGKTFSTLDNCIKRHLKHIYLRRSRTAIDISCTPEGNPYKALNAHLGYNLSVLRGKIPIIVNEGLDDPEVVGYGMAFNTLASLRGVSFEDCDITVFDEFQPTMLGSDRPYKQELQLLYNYYETVNRNRELEGKPPHKMIFLSNAVKITSPIIIGLGLVNIIEGMLRSGQQRYTDKERSIHIVILKDILVSKQKEDTVLYRMADDTFKRQSLSNAFTDDNFEDVTHRNLNEYMPFLCILRDKIPWYIYKHKSKAWLYVTSTQASVKETIDYDKSKHLFMRVWYMTLKEYLMAAHIEYDSYLSKVTFLTIMGEG